MIGGDRVAYRKGTAFEGARLCKLPPLAYRDSNSGHVTANLQPRTEALVCKSDQWGSLDINEKSSIVIQEAIGAGWALK